MPNYSTAAFSGNATFTPAANSHISPSKVIQLRPSAQLQTLGFNLDHGAATIAMCTDGTSNSIACAMISSVSRSRRWPASPLGTDILASS